MSDARTKPLGLRLGSTRSPFIFDEAADCSIDSISHQPVAGPGVASKVGWA